jgi:putative peptide zinc metalloprotease protein
MPMRSSVAPAPYPRSIARRSNPAGRARRHPARRGFPRWLGWVLALAALVAIGFIPYPYRAAGPFKLLPSKRLDLRFELEGLVEKVLVAEGDWVEAGQPVAALVRRTAEKNLKASEAQLQEKEAELRLLLAGPRPEEVDKAKKKLETARANVAWSGPRADRYAQLFVDKMLSAQDYESALRQRDIDARRLDEAAAELRLVKSGARPEEIEAMEAEIESQRALVANYRTDLERTTLVSPITGRIVTPRVEEMAGTYVKPGQRDLVAQVEDPRVIEAEVEIAEEDSAGLAVGAGVTLVPWAFHDRDLVGRVVSIAPVASASSLTQYDASLTGQSAGSGSVAISGEGGKVVRVVTQIRNDDGVLKSEMTGYAKVDTETRPVWDVLLRPLIRWMRVEVWYWIP